MKLVINTVYHKYQNVVPSITDTKGTGKDGTRSETMSTRVNHHKAGTVGVQKHGLEKNLGAEHPDILNTMENLAWAYEQQGHLTETAGLQEHLLEKRERTLGGDHPATLRTIDNLAWTYEQQGRLSETATLQEQVLETRIRTLGERHGDTLGTMDRLAWTYKQQGRLPESAKLQEQGLERKRIPDEQP